MSDSGERSALLRAGHSDKSSSTTSLPLHVAAMMGVTVRRARRRTELLASVLSRALPQPKPHEPMSSWGSFLFLSNLIMGPGILGLPVAYRHSGVVATTFCTLSFAAASVLACVLIAHATRIYRTEVRRAAGAACAAGARERGEECGPWTEPQPRATD